MQKYILLENQSDYRILRIRNLKCVYSASLNRHVNTNLGRYTWAQASAPMLTCTSASLVTILLTIYDADPMKSVSESEKSIECGSF